MKNYVIINGVNSLTITGLAISKLPSISKPPLRVMTEEINGRDGDLITELGYGAYDKELVIGLYGNYDINEVIGFFNQEGTIVFSNEDDKYYNFKIINQIDYEALIKFRTATISLHCQPFKYPLTETPEEITTEYVEDEGETITLNDTKIAPLSIDLKGNTTQNGTPTPDSPINVNVVSGDNEVVVCGKNLFNKDNSQIGKAWNNASASNRAIVITKVEPNTTYNISYQDKSGVDGIYFFGRTNENDSTASMGTTEITTNPRQVITRADTNYLGIQFNKTSISQTDIDNVGIQLEKGSTATPYEPYQSQNYPLYLGVENLFDKDNANVYNGYFTTTAPLTSNANHRTIYIEVKPNTTYTIQKSNAGGDNSRFGIGTTTTLPTTNVTVNQVALNNTYLQQTITTNTTTKYLVVWCYFTSNTAITFEELLATIKITKGSTPQHISDNPMELNKIGTYQDYIYKTDKWYLHKEVGKVVLNGSQGPWAKGSASGTTYSVFQADDWGVLLYVGSITSIYSDKLVGGDNFTAPLTGEYIQTGVYPNAPIRVSILNSRLSEVNSNGLNTYLATNNITCYIPLKTPTNIEITNTTLINQLEQLKGAMSYEGQTNISQVNNDLPFILSVKGIKEGSGEGIINNIGNIYAKPIIALEGTGNIGIYKNGTQYFEVDMSNDSKITIDTENMEAYHDGVLKNRQVIGDYNKFTIDEGNNNIEITGELTKATISNYTRWL